MNNEINVVPSFVNVTLTFCHVINTEIYEKLSTSEIVKYCQTSLSSNYPCVIFLAEFKSLLMMTALLSPTWVTMPDLIFGEVMLIVGIGNLECLHRCRQVCKYWNEKIMTIIWENSRNTKIITSSIEKTWAANLEVFPWTFPFSNEEIFHFANLEVFPWTFPSNEEISHFKWLGEY